MGNNEDQKKPVSLNVFEEKAQVEKRVIEKGKVRIEKKVHTRHKKINVDVKSEEVIIERVPVNKYIDVPPPVRYEGYTTIVSVVKEVAIVEKKILLVEEIHITKQVNTREQENTVPLMEEEIVVEATRSK